MSNPLPTSSDLRGALRARLRVLTLLAGAAFLIGTLPGCYLAKQGTYLLRDQWRAVPISELESAERRLMIAFITEVEAIRRYATELGLEVGESYTRVVRTDRDHLVDVVNATSATSFERHEWWWPFAGRFPYKGFYDPSDARALAERLRRRGLDVWVREVDAFSTLGVFSDPLYEFMADYSIYRLANLIIHESVHSTIYLKNHGQFNEELATFIGDKAALDYVAHRFGRASEQYSRVLAQKEDAASYRSDVLALKEEFAGLYEQADAEEAAGEDRILAQKARVIERFQAEFRESYDQRYLTDAYLPFGELAVNNAYLDLFIQYTSDTELFQQLLAQCGGELRTMIDALSPLADLRSLPTGAARSLARSDPKEWISTTLLDSGERGSVD